MLCKSLAYGGTFEQGEGEGDGGQTSEVGGQRSEVRGRREGRDGVSVLRCFNAGKARKRVPRRHGGALCCKSSDPLPPERRDSKPRLAALDLAGPFTVLRNCVQSSK